MPSILNQIKGKPANSAYRFGEVISVTDKALGIRLTTGLEVIVASDGGTYSIGDQVVLGIDGEKFNNLFLIQRLDKTYPNSVNFVVGLDTD